MNLLLILGAWMLVATVFTLIWGALCRFSDDTTQDARLEQQAQTQEKTRSISA